MRSLQQATIGHDHRPRPLESQPAIPDVTHHLIMVHRPGWQSVDDWRRIAAYVREIEPRIAVFLVNWATPASYTRRAAGLKPTLVFSTGPLGAFRPRRGAVYQGRQIEKLEQLRLLARGGVPVPRTALLAPRLMLDPAEWGEIVIIKPSYLGASSHGQGVQLVRTRRVRYVAPQDYPPSHPGRLGPMIVQQFIDTGDPITSYRLLTLFGEPLYCIYSVGAEKRVALQAPDAELEAGNIAMQAMDSSGAFVSDPDVLAIGKAAYAALPDVPLQGCDVLRETRTGRLYLLEVNPRGNTWHFSSSFLADERATNGPDFERKRVRQFDALRTAARVLAARTMQGAI